MQIKKNRPVFVLAHNAADLRGGGLLLDPGEQLLAKPGNDARVLIRPHHRVGLACVGLPVREDADVEPFERMQRHAGQWGGS